jgi:hypothetical protein
MKDQTVLDAFKILYDRLKPAVLDRTAHNGVLLQRYIDDNNAHTDDTAALAESLYQAVKQEMAKLNWIQKPKQLLLQEERGIRNQNTAQHDQAAFVQRVRDSEAATQNAKTQAAAKVQLENIIANVMFVDGFKGTILHGKTEAIKATCKAHVTKAEKSGRDLTTVVAEIQNFITEQYEIAEKAVERIR